MLNGFSSISRQQKQISKMNTAEKDRMEEQMDQLSFSARPMRASTPNIGEMPKGRL